MRIMFVVHSTDIHGSTISLINLIKGLVEIGYDVAISCPININPDFREKVCVYNVKIFEIPMYFDIIPDTCRNIVKYYIMKPLLLYRRYKSKFLLRNAIIEWKPDIVHTNVGIIHIAYEVCKELNVKHVWHLREYQSKDFNWKILPSKSRFEKMLRETDAVITITHDILNFFSLDECTNACCIYNGIFPENDLIHNYPKEKYFLCSSRISPEKGFTDVLKAFVIFHQDFPEYRLRIAGVGDEWYINQLKEIAIQGNCVNSIDFLGFVPDVRTLMSKAKALIVASFNEGFGRMTAEAFFCGCPVIGRNVAGTKEILDRTDSYPYLGDEYNLFSVMRQVVTEEDCVYRDKIQNSQKIAKLLYSNEQYVDQVVKVYQTLKNN